MRDNGNLGAEGVGLSCPHSHMVQLAVVLRFSIPVHLVTLPVPILVPLFFLAFLVPSAPAHFAYCRISPCFPLNFYFLIISVDSSPVKNLPKWWFAAKASCIQVRVVLSGVISDSLSQIQLLVCLDSVGSKWFLSYVRASWVKYLVLG